MLRWIAGLALASCVAPPRAATAGADSAPERAGTPPIRITLQHGSARERQTRADLLHAVNALDLTPYTFTREIVIDEGAINHSFRAITLNVRFSGSEDELLSPYLHEQLHWHLRDHNAQQQEAIAELQRMYPRAPVGRPEGAETAYSTYGRLVDCYLEIQADRRLIGAERTARVIERKPNYTWIYGTILRDEPRIAALARKYRLEVLSIPG